MFCEILWCICFCKMMVALSIPESTVSFHSAAERFQNSVQQQSFQSVLLAIEERLRNLDNIYSMQLSETLKSKVDSYHRKLESLDTKIMRLESIMMLNLDRLSENISTKNHKDEVTRTQTFRKLENVYDGLSNKINYMDRKFDLSFDKVQSKLDTTMVRLERIEEEMIQNKADIDSELSETISILEDYKTSSVADMKETLLNITNVIKENSSTQMAEAVNMTIKDLTENFNKPITGRLAALENSTNSILNMSNETNAKLISMKAEMKEDFNAYANKVADMNVDIWKRNDEAEEIIKTIEAVTNFTRTEVQNGVRALMLQIGKLSGKGIMNNDKTSLELLRKSVNLSLEKIIANQELFLESCHRVQMDESQIESEISVMLGKLIDMLETKMTTVMKDLKNIEKGVKSHDSRVNRNLNQANSNVISLFEKTIRANDLAEKELHDIKFYVNSLFSFVQDVLPRMKGSKSTEVLLNDISRNISNLIQHAIENRTNNTVIMKMLEDCASTNNTIATFAELKNSADMHHRNLTNNINNSLVEIRKTIERLQMTLDNWKRSPNEGVANNIVTDLSKTTQNTIINCTKSLIDIRAEKEPCDSSTGGDEYKLNRTILEIFGTPPSTLTTGKTHDLLKMPKNQLEDDKKLNRTILEIFGTPPPPPTAHEKTRDFSNGDSTKNPKGCVPQWTNLINIRLDNDDSKDNCTKMTKKVKSKKRKYKPKLVMSRSGSQSITNEQNGINMDADLNEESDLTDTTSAATTEATTTEIYANDYSDTTNKFEID